MFFWLFSHFLLPRALRSYQFPWERLGGVIIQLIESTFHEIWAVLTRLIFWSSSILMFPGIFSTYFIRSKGQGQNWTAIYFFIIDVKKCCFAITFVTVSRQLFCCWSWTILLVVFYIGDVNWPWGTITWKRKGSKVKILRLSSSLIISTQTQNTKVIISNQKQ